MSFSISARRASIVMGWDSGREGTVPFSSEPTLSSFFSSAPGLLSPAGRAAGSRRASDKGITTPGKLMRSFFVNGFTQKGILAVLLRETTRPQDPLLGELAL